MNNFTRRTFVQGTTALAATGALTGTGPVRLGQGLGPDIALEGREGRQAHRDALEALRRGRGRGVQRDGRRLQGATGTDMNVFSESFEDVQPKASVAANTGSGLDLVWGLHTLPQLFPDKVLQMTDVADYLGKKYGGWTEAAAVTCKQGNKWIGIPVATIGGYMNYRKSVDREGGLQGSSRRIPRASSSSARR